MLDFYKIWCETNAKKISKEEFTTQTGYNFDKFFKKNKKHCLLSWRLYLRCGKENTKDVIEKKKEIPRYILHKEQKLKEKLKKISELKKQLLKT